MPKVLKPRWLPHSQLALLPKTSQKARPASSFAGAAGREPERSVHLYVSAGSGARHSLQARSRGVAAGRKFPAVVLGIRAIAALVALGPLGGCGENAQGATRACAVPVGDSPAWGPADAWVTAVEFADFQCPYCGSVVPTVDRIDAERPGLVRWVFKHLPIASHPRALPASVAAECAHQQGRFWEMHDLLYAHQTALDDASLVAYATEIALDLPAWQTCRASGSAGPAIQRDQALADEVGVMATPTFLVNGTPLIGAWPYPDFLSAVDRAHQAAESSGVPAPDYYASLELRGCAR
jgi:protein-disulfide isomerase